jgi:hypothetical protein
MSIVKVFLDMPTQYGIPGLTKVLLQNNIVLAAVPSGTMFMFVNRKRTQVKILWDSEYLLHLRKDRDPWTIEELKKIPMFFKNTMIGPKIEQQLSKYIAKRVSVSVDEAGLRVG